jgi:hypothetical protein
VGPRLRRQFLIAAILPAIGGLSLCISFWNMLYLHIPAPGDVWYAGQIADIVNFFLFYPHHLVGMVCCMFALLLAWIGVNSHGRDRIVVIVFIGMALGSAFGLSIYVTFAFFLLMLAWAFCQLLIHRKYSRPILLFSGGAISCVLLLPYLGEITHSESKMYSGRAFVLSVRETIPPDRLVHLEGFASVHPAAARTLAKLMLMPAGYALELGVYFLVLLVFLVPAWHGRRPLSEGQRMLVFMAVVTFPITSFIRSGVININDFGIHSALFIEYPLLLLMSELLICWKFENRKLSDPGLHAGLPGPSPSVLRSLVTLAIIVGVLSTTWRTLVLRFILPVSSINASEAQNPKVAELPHQAYISYRGYAELNRQIPTNAVVQFNPTETWLFWKNVDLVNINRQTAIAAGQLWCGSELGGDSSACPAMIYAIVPIFNDASADQAKAVCHTYGIHYLVVNVYDPAWSDRNSWVWTLPTVVADPEFRALDCQ